MKSVSIIVGALLCFIALLIFRVNFLDNFFSIGIVIMAAVFAIPGGLLLYLGYKED